MRARNSNWHLAISQSKNLNHEGHEGTQRLRPSSHFPLDIQFSVLSASIRGKRFAILPSMAFKRPKEIDDENALYDYAIRSLGRRMRPSPN